MLGVIGGSGLSRLESLEAITRTTVRTPYGDPSGPLTIGAMRGGKVVFIARHGDAHTLAPHKVNYRANVWALREAGAQAIVAVATVGGIGAAFTPGLLVVPDQIIDYTSGRAATFFEDDGAPVTHIDFTEPYSSALRARIRAAAERCGEPLRDRGTYAATQGPRLETAAEIDRLARDGADVVGMTGMPEAALAREAGVDYASIAVVVNTAAGRGESRYGISLEDARRVMDEAMHRVRRIIAELAAQ